MAPGHYFDGIAAGHSVFRDEQSRILRRDGMDAWIVHVTIAGSGRIRCGDHERIGRPGDAVLFAMGAVHDYGVAAGAHDWQHLWVHFNPRPHWFDWLNWRQVGPGIGWLSLAGHELLPRIEAAFRRVIERLQEGARLAREQAMNGVEEILLWCDEANPASGQRDPRIRRALDWLHDHLAQRIGVDDLARVAGCSSSRLAHLFSEQMGLPPMRYLEGARLDWARELLLMGDQPVAQVGEQVGFDDPTWFGRCFARRYGASPRAYRRQHGLR